MKTIGRIIIILAAALVVVGATLAIANSAGASQSTGRFPDGEHIRPAGGDGDFAPRQRPDGGTDRDHDGGGFLIGSLLGRLAMVSVIVLIFLAIERMAGGFRKKKPLPVPIQ